MRPGLTDFLAVFTAGSLLALASTSVLAQTQPPIGSLVEQVTPGDTVQPDQGPGWGPPREVNRTGFAGGSRS